MERQHEDRRVKTHSVAASSNLRWFQRATQGYVDDRKYSGTVLLTRRKNVVQSTDVRRRRTRLTRSFLTRILNAVAGSEFLFLSFIRNKLIPSDVIVSVTLRPAISAYVTRGLINHEFITGRPLAPHRYLSHYERRL
ncbi:hypothetical protein DAEQUDRAFT_371909 [Daedalea quercina L-15889]|uniref:Uncharacterized protein n=1 Tax=Daedalea quercina L-15889 TaxID=1314783 RepID=A0A165P649_9APHY|nr:hypothetical protein DAEQUDRAFT_371909 [Daedalea quercina L-15889]